LVFFFIEIYFSWKAVDPVEANDGPSKWNYSNYDTRSKVILQTSPIKGRNINQAPAILELLLDKVNQKIACSNLKILLVLLSGSHKKFFVN
jgi:hypothetical protein